MKMKKSSITSSTKLTMAICAGIVLFSAALLVFLIFFPIPMENPSNGINEKLIASATTYEITTTTTVTTTTSFVNTRKTTDRNRETTTETYTETYDDYYNEY